MIDFGPFIDPVLVDLIIKGCGIIGILVIIYFLNKNQKTMIAGFSSMAHEPVLEAQAQELKRHASLLIAELEVCNQEIGILKRLMAESQDDYNDLEEKYVNLLLRVVRIEEEHAATIRKISLPMQEVHTGDTIRPHQMPSISMGTLPLSPLPPPFHRTSLRNENSVTKKVQINDNTETKRVYINPKKPLPREEK